MGVAETILNGSNLWLWEWPDVEECTIGPVVVVVDVAWEWVRARAERARKLAGHGCTWVYVCVYAR